MTEPQKAYLTLPVETGFLPVATGFVEQASLAFGLAKPQALALTLATEEVFAYLCGLGRKEQALEISCENRIYYVQVDLKFTAQDFNMAAFNLTSKVRLDDQTGLDEMGLIIAARSVDRFRLSRFQDKGITLSLIKEKAYPQPKAGGKIALKNLDAYNIRLAEKEEIKFFSSLLAREYDSVFYPPAFGYPGKLADMVAGGEFQVSLALDRAGSVGGGMAWRWVEEKTVICFGPYVFGQKKPMPMAEELVNHCLGLLARTKAGGIMHRLPTPELPREHFESLGNYSLQKPDGSFMEMEAFFRQLTEDPGEVIWAHPDLEGLLQKEYHRLFLPREVRLVSDQGENRPNESVLAADLSRGLGFATLYPVRDGKDVKENLTRHVALFKQQKIGHIFFEMDLGRSWQAGFYPALAELDFSPRFVMPHVGKGDILFFQRVLSES